MTNQAPALIQKNITDSVIGSIGRLKNDGLAIAPNYNPTNALKSAFFAMTNSASGNLLEKCSQESVANSLLDMVVQGLNPAKTQCYFIPYGNQLKMTRSYFGTQKVVKSLAEVEDIWANVIYEGDVFEYEIGFDGRERLVEHKTSFLNRDNKILGAYAIVKTKDQGELLTVMTMKEIDVSWSQGRTKNVQQKFPQEMAKRTVINRAAKAFINTSDDSDALIDSINRTTSNEFEDSERMDVTPQDVQATIDTNQASESLDFEAEPMNVDYETGEVLDSKPQPVKKAEKVTIDTPEDLEQGQLFASGVKSSLDNSVPF